MPILQEGWRAVACHGIKCNWILILDLLFGYLLQAVLGNAVFCLQVSFLHLSYMRFSAGLFARALQCSMGKSLTGRAWRSPMCMQGPLATYAFQGYVS